MLSCSNGSYHMMSFSRNLTYQLLLSVMMLPLCHLFKIFHGLCSSSNPYRPHPRPSLRHLNSCAVDPPFCRLSLSKSSFYPYAPTLWNYLPEAVVKSTSLQAFKLAVHSHLLSPVMCVSFPCYFILLLLFVWHVFVLFCTFFSLLFLVLMFF